MLRLFGAVGLTSPESGLVPFPVAVSLDRTSLEGKDTVPMSGALCRASALHAIGGFDEREDLAGVEDYDLFLRLADVGAVAFVPRIHGGYRVHGGGISRDPAIQGERIRRLLAARGVEGRWRPIPRYSAPALAARNLAHITMGVALRLRERVDRGFGRPVPVQRRRLSS